MHSYKRQSQCGYFKEVGADNLVKEQLYQVLGTKTCKMTS